jgi:hypothetical protein
VEAEGVDRVAGTRLTKTVFTVAAIILVSSLYVLSIGPAAWFYVKTGYGEWYFRAACWPVQEVVRVSESGCFLERYVNHWMPSAPDGEHYTAYQDTYVGIRLTHWRRGWPIAIQ